MGEKDQEPLASKSKRSYALGINEMQSILVSTTKRSNKGAKLAEERSKNSSLLYPQPWSDGRT